MCTVTLAVAVAGCGGPRTLDRAKVEKEAQGALSKSLGKQFPAVTCPGDLKQEMGATTRCHADFPEGKRLGLTVKVKSVDGSYSGLSFATDDKLTRQP